MMVVMFSNSLVAWSMNSFQVFDSFSSAANSFISRFFSGFCACHLSERELRSPIQNSKARVRTCAAKIIWSVKYFMVFPFGGVLWNSQSKPTGNTSHQPATQAAGQGV